MMRVEDLCFSYGNRQVQSESFSRVPDFRNKRAVRSFLGIAYSFQAFDGNRLDDDMPVTGLVFIQPDSGEGFIQPYQSAAEHRVVV